jgi:putative transcriptional regulator
MQLRVRTFRHQSGLTQAELAQKMSCSRELISAIETGRHAPNTDLLARLADTLGVAIHAFFVDDYLPACATCPQRTGETPHATAPRETHEGLLQVLGRFPRDAARTSAGVLIFVGVAG